MILRRPMILRRSGVCARVHGVLRSRCVHPWWPCGHESRDGVCGRVWKAERCVSSAIACPWQVPGQICLLGWNHSQFSSRPASSASATCGSGGNLPVPEIWAAYSHEFPCKSMRQQAIAGHCRSIRQKQVNRCRNTGSGRRDGCNSRCLQAGSRNGQCFVGGEGAFGFTANHRSVNIRQPCFN